MAGAPAPAALSAALFWQPHTNAPAASASSKAAARLSGASLLVLQLTDTNGRMLAYLTSDLTTLMEKSKIVRGSGTCWTRGPAIGYLESVGTVSRNRGNRFVFRRARVAECPSVPAGQKLCPGKRPLPPLARRQTPRPGLLP